VTFNQRQLANWLSGSPGTVHDLELALTHTGATYDRVYSRLRAMERHGWVKRKRGSSPTVWELTRAGERARTGG